MTYSVFVRFNEVAFVQLVRVPLFYHSVMLSPDGFFVPYRN